MLTLFNWWLAVAQPAGYLLFGLRIWIRRNIVWHDAEKTIRALLIQSHPHREVTLWWPAQYRQGRAPPDTSYIIFSLDPDQVAQLVLDPP